jgi:serine/threonine-protein kinase
MSLIGKTIGNYVIKAKLGEGGMGAVYLGEHPLIGKRVAIKVLLEELAAKEDIVSRFFNEAKAVNDIQHQNIVDIVDFGKMKTESNTDMVYFIMEFLDGESLSARLRRTGLSFQETLHVISQCCSALAASHRKNIVHRDLKPENIFLCPRGDDKNFVKILDFGIAKLTGDGGASSKTRTGLVIGTPAYMSPEQCEGKGQIDHRSDVYSLGVVMYELLTGRVPFPGEGFGEILVAHLTRQPENPSQLNPDIAPEIEALVLHAIEKDRNRRFQNMDEFLEAVKNPGAHLQAYSPLPGYTPSQTGSTTVVGHGGSGATQTGRGPTTGVAPRPTTLSGAAGEVGDAPMRKSRTPVFVAAGVVGLLLVGGGIFAFRGNGKPKDGPTTPTTEQPNVPTAPEKVSIKVNSIPPGARIFRADTGAYVDGVTPLEFQVEKDNPTSFDIQIKLDGYKSAVRSISSEKDQDVAIILAKLDVPTPPVAPPPTVAVNDPKDKDKKSSRRDRDKDKDKRPSSSPSGSTPKSGGDSSDDMKLLQPKF